MSTISLYLCRFIAPDGFRYSGYWEGHYHFVKGDNRTGFETLSCLESDITDGNYQVMADEGLTRILGFKY